MLSYKQNPPEQKVLGISASPRKRGNSDFLLNTIMQTLTHHGIKNSSVYLREQSFSSCIGCERCRKDNRCSGIKDDMSLIYPNIISSQAFVWVTPVHIYNVTALMKAFIDRMYCFYNFNTAHPRAWSSQLANQNRKAIIVAIGEQADKEDFEFTTQYMKMVLDSFGYKVVGELEVYGIFEKGGVKKDSASIQSAKNLAKLLAKELASI